MIAQVWTASLFWLFGDALNEGVTMVETMWVQSISLK